MIEKFHIFSENPLGKVWLCSECDYIHLRYGNAVLILNRAFVEKVYWDAFGSSIEAYVCEDCSRVHFCCGDATLHLSLESFDKLLEAFGDLVHATLESDLFGDALKQN